MKSVKNCQLLKAFLLVLLLGSPAILQAQQPVTANFLFIADVHLDPNSPKTTYGQDAGMDVWNALKVKLDAVMSAKDAPKFVIYTGDLPVHNSWCAPLAGTAASTHDTAIAMVLNELRYLSVKYKKPVFYMPGNNDALSGDYLSYTNASGQSPLSLVQSAPLFFPKGKAAAGAGYPSIISQNVKDGYYSARLMPGLRLIALNTVILNNGCPDTGRPQESAAEMVWLRNQLKAAKQAGDKVYIAMHVPPGNTYNGGQMWNTAGGVWVDSFLQMAANYSTTIAGVFYGHTHMDELRRLHNKWSGGDTVTAVAICCPGISAQHTNNPGFKVVTYDTKTKAPVDFTTYYTPLPMNGAWPGSSYSFRQIFGCQSGSIYQCLKNRDANTLATQVAQIYEVMNSQEPVTSGTVIGFIDVEPQ